jgi:ParB family chromosome partitioning protein
LEELAASIKEEGLLYPITVEGPHDPTDDIPNVFYILIDGERRLRSVKLLGRTYIKALIRDPKQIDRKKRALLALVANLQRDNLSPIDEAKAFQRLETDFGMNVTQIARKTGFSAPMIKSRLQLLKLEEDIQNLIAQGDLQKDHRLIDALLSIDDSQKRFKLAKTLAKRGASVKAGVTACQRLNQHIHSEQITNEETPAVRIAAIKAGRMPLPKYDVFVASGVVPEWDLVKGSAKHVCDNCVMRSNASDVVCKECPLAQFITHLTKKVNR